MGMRAATGDLEAVYWNGWVRALTQGTNRGGSTASGSRQWCLRGGGGGGGGGRWWKCD